MPLLGQTIKMGRLRRWLKGKAGTADLLRLGRRDHDRLAWQGHKRFRKGRYQEAERIYQLMATLWPLEAAPLLALGACRQAQGALDDAVGFYSRVILAEPENVYALANRAEVRILQRHLHDAKVDLLVAFALIQRLPTPRPLDERVRELLRVVNADPVALAASEAAEETGAIPLEE
jgi:tetratricopeptide (TPR) repeat protein